MGTSKPKFCKCGHNKKYHKHGNFSVSSHCDVCQCSSYLNRDRPNKTDYAMMLIGFVFAFAIAIISIVAVIGINPELAGTENETVVLRAGELYIALVLIIIFFVSLIMLWCVLDPVLAIMSAKKRRKFEMDDKHE